MFRKKRAIGFFLCITIVFFFTLFRHSLLRAGIHLALGLLLPEKSITCEAVSWEKRALVLKGIEIEEEGYRAAIEEAAIKGQFTFFPFSFEPQVSLKNPVFLLNQERSSTLDFSFPLLGYKIEVPQGSLICGEEHLFFSLRCGAQVNAGNSLILSYNADLTQDPLISIDLNKIEETFAAQFCVHKIECAHIVQLVSSFFPEWREGWENLEGWIEAKGNLLFSVPFAIEDIQIELEMAELALVNPALKLNAYVEHFQGECRFPIKGSLRETHYPFWQQASASLSLNQGSLKFEEWGVFAESVQLILDPHTDPYLHLTGALSHRDQEYPVQLTGKGSIHEDHSFWMEINVQSEEDESIFCSLCSQEKENYILQVDFKNIPSSQWGNLPLVANWVVSEGLIQGKWTGWIESNRIERWQLENLIATDVAFERGCFAEVIGEGCAIRKEEGEWNFPSLELQIKEGLFDDLKGSLSFSMKEEVVNPSCFKGIAFDLPVEVQFQGPISEISGHATLSCAYSQLIELMTGKSVEGNQLLVVEASFQQKALRWEAIGSCLWEGQEAFTFGYHWKEGLIQEGEGRFISSQIPSSMLNLFPLEGNVSCEGYFNAEGIQLSYRGEKMHYAHSQINCQAESIDNGLLCFDRKEGKWKASLSFANACIQEKMKSFIWEKAEGTLYFDEDTLQVDMKKGSIPLTNELSLQEMRGRLEYDLTTGDIRLEAGAGQLTFKDHLYPLLIDKLNIDRGHIGYDLSLFDKEREIARIFGEGDLNKRHFSLNPIAHILDVRLNSCQLAFKENGFLSLCDLHFEMRGEKWYSILEYLEPLGLAPSNRELLNLLKGSNFDIHIDYYLDRWRLTVEDKIKQLALISESREDSWEITRLSYGDWDIKGNCKWDINSLDISDVTVHHPKGEGKGEIKVTFEPFQAFGKMDIKGSSPYGEIVSLQPLAFSYTPLKGLFIEQANMTLAGTTFSAQTISYQLDAQKGSIEKVDFSGLLPFLPDLPIIGSAGCTFTADNYAIEGKITDTNYIFYDNDWKFSEIVFALDAQIAHLSAKTFYNKLPLWLTLGVDLNADGLKLLKIQDKIDSNGVKILFRNNKCESIHGSMSGLDIHFVKKNHYLSGVATLDMGKLGALLPAAYNDFKLGKGYRVMGDLFLTQQTAQDPYFRGKVTGKDFELMGYQLDDLEAEVEIAPEKIKITNLHIGDRAGEFSMKQIKCLHAGIWVFEAPLLQIRDFQPSRLRSLSGNSITDKPFRISHFSLMDLQGELRDISTFVGIGTLNFSNKEKKAASFLDMPLDMIKELGLDLDLLTPIRGYLQCKLRGDRLYFMNLKKSLSEGARSEFYLSTEKPSYLSLNGALHIDLKMRQNVVLKLMEPLTLKIRGTLDHPKYQLSL